MKIDITPLVNAILALLATLITAYAIPWLKAKAGEAKIKMSEKQLYVYELIADMAVKAAQQIYCDNKEKLEYALRVFEGSCLDHGIIYDSTAARAYIEAAVKNMKVVDKLNSCSADE